MIVEGDDGIFRVGRKIFCTDFSSFEALFTEEFSEATEQQLFIHCLSRLPEFSKKLLDLVRRVCWGANTTCYSYKDGDRVRQLLFKVWLRRMSGEMWTSLGNGFANLMVILYAVQEASRGVEITVQWFAKLGLICKLEEYDHLDDATFCGLIFDPEALQAITDPRATLLKFGWTAQRYSAVSRRTKMKLLRSKALSLAYEVPCCPILTAFARRVMSLTEGIDDGVAIQFAEDRWYKEQMLKEIAAGRPGFVEPTAATRLLFERRFGISVQEQLEAEALIAEMQLGPAPHRLVDLLHFDDINFSLWEEYVTATPADREGFVPRASWRDLPLLGLEHTRAAKLYFKRRKSEAAPRASRYFPELV